MRSGEEERGGGGAGGGWNAEGQACEYSLGLALAMGSQRT